jgi:hypothetical protein
MDIWISKKKFIELPDTKILNEMDPFYPNSIQIQTLLRQKVNIVNVIYVIYIIDKVDVIDIIDVIDVIDSLNDYS